METPPDSSHASYATIRSESISSGNTSLPSMNPYEAVEGGGVGLTGPYLAQAFQAVYDLPHEDGERQAVMVRR